MKYIIFLLFTLLFSQSTIFAEVLTSISAASIRKVQNCPFSKGNRIEKLWSRADKLTGFIVVDKLDAAIDATELQFLYDDNFLYISVKAFYEKGAQRKLTKPDILKDNTFELRIGQKSDAANIRSFAISKGYSVHSSKIVSGAATPVSFSGKIDFKVSEFNGGYVLNASIPVSALNIGDKLLGKKAAILPLRHNICFRDGYSEYSAWGAIENKINAFNSANWEEVVFAEDDGSQAQTVYPLCRNHQVNYFSNPEFDLDKRSWRLEGGEQTLRCETAPMSKEWIVRTSGNTYRFLMGIPQRYERNTDYTLVVRARGFGGESQMNILEVYKRDGDGKMSEGPQIARQVLLGEQFHTYYFPYKSTNNGEPHNIVLYKWQPKDAADRGIDVSSVRLVKGRVGALDLRRISRDERKAPQGEGVPMAENPYGKTPTPLKGLVFSLRLFERREILEVFEGTGIKVDILSTTSPNQDIYYTDDDIESIKSNIQGNGYDFYFVMSHVAGNIGPIVASNMLASIGKGAGLYFMNSPKKGSFAQLVKNANLKPVDSNHEIFKSYLTRLGCGVENFRADVLFKEGKFGNGRVFAEGSGRTGPFKFTMNQLCYGVTDFPYWTFADPLMIKIIRRISRRGNENPKTAVKTQWRAVDAWGMISKTGSALDEASAIEAARKACDVSGRYAVALKNLDEGGNTVEWNARIFDVAGPEIALREVRASCNGDEPALFDVYVSGMPNGGTVKWTLEDFSGRIIEKGLLTGKRLEVPVKTLYTNKGVVRVYLELAGKTKAVARADVYARNKDWDRLSKDFTVGIWGQGGFVSRETSVIMNRLLINNGILYHCNPVGYFLCDGKRNMTLALSTGMAVGGGYLGDGSWFFPKQLDGSNVRSSFGPINTKEGRRKMAELAVKNAQGSCKYGPISYAVCDEPNLSLRYTKDEPDEEPENVAEFRRRMEQKYGHIAEYNRRHRTAHSSFADIQPARIENARKTGNFAEYVEWRNFNVDRWCEAIKILADNGSKVDPTCRLSLYNSFGQTAVSGNDYWKLLTKAGMDFSNEYTGMVYMGRRAIYNFDEFYRSFRPDMRVWGFTGYSLPEQKIRFTPWWFAAHRYGGFTWFSVLTWDWRYFDQPTLAYTKDAMELKATLDSSRLQSGLGKLFLSYDWVPRKTAIYYSHDSLLTSTLLGKERVSYDIGPDGPLHDYMYSRQGLQYTIEDLLYQYDYVAPEQILSGKLKNYRILFMPRILALSDSEVSHLKAFMADGGKIVADQLPGDFDELGVKRAVNPFASSGIKVLGKNFDDLSPECRRQTLAWLKSSGASPILDSKGIEKVFGREAMHFSDGINSVFVVLRMPARSTDAEIQNFTFPGKGHVYDVRARKYIGFTDNITAAVPHAEASVWAVLPKKIGSMRISMPSVVKAGEDLNAVISLAGAVGKGVFNVQVISPDGTSPFHMKRNIDSEAGKACFSFRMAANDKVGKWKLRVTDAITGVETERSFNVVRVD